MRRIVLATALLLLAACDREPDFPIPAGTKPPDFPALPDLKPSNDFSSDGFMELPAEGAAAFGWDLRGDVHHNYWYEQESHLVVSVTGDGKSGKLTSRTQWKGGAEVIGGGGKGEIAFVASPFAQWNNEQPLLSEELNKVPKAVIRYLLREDGAISGAQIMSGQEDPMVDVFLALPSRALKPGERDSRAVHLARLQGAMRYHGQQEFEHAGRRKVGRHECVKLMSKLDLEATPPEDGQGRMIGRIAAYVDPKERRFVRVDVALVMAVDVRREVRPADPHAKSFWQMNRVQADTRVTILLKD